MTLTTALLKAKHIGIREMREHLSKRMKDKNPLIVTDHGEPTKVIFSYQDVLELIEILDELQDRVAVESVQEGRKVIKKGTEGISVSGLFHQIKNSRK